MTATTRKMLLLAARDLIAQEGRWTKKLLACTETRRPVMWHDEEACRWCAVGAVRRAALDLVGEETRAQLLADEVLNACLPRNLSAINDQEGHAAVLAVFDWALATA